MLKIYNRQALTRQQRMVMALIFGALACLVCVGIHLILTHVYKLYIELVYIGFGFLIGYAIRYFGHGVQVQFSILAVVLTLVTITVCDLLVYPFSSVMIILTQYGISSLISVGYRIVACVLAWRFARIV